jgi:Tfp pilus assembly protein PilX
MKPILRAKRHVPVVHREPRYAGRAERGIIVIITLICLVVLLLSSIALVRSFTNANIVAGGVAIKRDMVNEAQQGLAVAVNQFTTVNLNSVGNQGLAEPGSNYSPCMLPSDSYGIPIIIEDNDTNFAGTADLDGSQDTNCSSSPVAQVANDLPVNANTQASIRYVIDRLCTTTAPSTSATCVVTTLGQVSSGTQYIKRTTGAAKPVFRVTVRVKIGNLTSYAQTTVS